MVGSNSAVDQAASCANARHSVVLEQTPEPLFHQRPWPWLRRLLFFDIRARLLLGPASKDCCGELLEHFTVTVREKGPVNTRATYRGRPQAVRLFSSDDGMGVVLLGQRTELACVAAEQLMMHQRILATVRDAVVVTTAEPIGSPGPVIV